MVNSRYRRAATPISHHFVKPRRRRWQALSQIVAYVMTQVSILCNILKMIISIVMPTTMHYQPLGF